jgi:DivIVA domain-containing protein
VELDRQFIERNDFGVARRGYDPDEVDRHLRELADAVAELKRTQRKSSPASLATAAAEQVRGIVEAAERSASDIQSQAEGEARRIVDEANQGARQAREQADSDAMQRVQSAEQATERMLERTGGVEGEIDRLLGELRSAAGALVENLRTSASGLNDELRQIREEFAGVREARLETGGGTASYVTTPAASEPEPEPEPEAVSAVDGDAGPVDAEPEIVAEVEETVVEIDVEPEEEYEEPVVAEAAEEEAEAEEEEEEVAVAEEAPADSSARGGRSIRGAEGARLIALNMALNGTPRDETARYLSQNFDLDDQDALLDEVYARVGD